jgi:hypothetical protein
MSLKVLHREVEKRGGGGGGVTYASERFIRSIEICTLG